MNVTFDGGLRSSTDQDQTMRRGASNSSTSPSTQSSLVCLFIRNRQPTAGLKSAVAINQSEIAILSVSSAQTASIGCGKISSKATSSFTGYSCPGFASLAPTVRNFPLRLARLDQSVGKALGVEGWESLRVTLPHQLVHGFDHALPVRLREVVAIGSICRPVR